MDVTVCGLAVDLTSRQRLLEALDFRICDLGAVQVEIFQLPDFLQVDQPRVRDIGLR